jgi:3-deoxy-7-phosphoheptulonate synthase
MIIVTKPDTTEEQLQHIVERIGEWGLKAQISRGAVRTVVGSSGLRMPCGKTHRCHSWCGIGYSCFETV